MEHSNKQSQHKESSKSKVLSQEDVDFIKKMKGSLLKKRSRSEVESEESDNDDDDDEGGFEYVVNPSSLVPAGRLQKSTKIEKMKKILEGRNPVKFVHEGHAGGLTNKEQKRKKNYLMVRRGKRSVTQKTRKSLSDVRAANNSRVSYFSCSSVLIFNEFFAFFSYRKKFTAEISASAEELNIHLCFICVPNVCNKIKQHLLQIPSQNILFSLPCHFVQISNNVRSGIISFTYQK